MRLFAVFSLLLAAFAPAAFADGGPPAFPWTMWAGGMNHDQPGGIMAEPGIQYSGGQGTCGPGKDVVLWYIRRANGEHWQLYAAIEKERWVGVQFKEDDPIWWYAGKTKGDAITVERSEKFNLVAHPDPCSDLFPEVV